MTDLAKEIEFLFDRYWDEDLTEEQEDNYDNKAEAVITDHGWDTVYEAFKKYLIEKCTTPEQVVNAAHIFWEFSWHENKISDPYTFMSYFYYRINFDANKYDSSDILDSLTTYILPKNGIISADVYVNPYYMPEKDPEMIAAVERWKGME